jgi:hypothetical protein
MFSLCRRLRLDVAGAAVELVWMNLCPAARQATLAAAVERRQEELDPSDEVVSSWKA